MGLSVGLLHGQMKGPEKEEVMAQFRAGELERPGRDGRDRGRRGRCRGERDRDRGRVALRSGPTAPIARPGRARRRAELLLLARGRTQRRRRVRLQALVDSNDGFALAEVDLDLRGEGTLLGARQRGRSDLRLANLRRDEDLLIAAQSSRFGARPVDGLGLEPELVDELRLFVDDDEADYLFKS